MHTEKIKWLHLSDFHVGQDDYGQTQLFKSILKHVSEQKERGITPDYIFVTGDLAYKGAASEYIKFNTDFLEPLQKIIGNGIENRTFTVPGNHDVDRNKASGFSAEKFLNSSNNYFNPTQEGMEQRKPIFERFKGFADFDLTPTLGEWITSSEGAYSFEENIKGVNVGIVGINTAWLSEKINEAKMLSPGKFIVENILSKVDKNDLVIVLGHHPLDWFAEGHRRPIESLFGKNNVLYLHGHLHDVWVTPQYGGGHMFLPIQCGAAFQAREDGFYKNGLLWTEVDITSGLISLQPWTWNTVHQEWGINSEAFPSVNKKGDFWEFLLPTKKKLSTVKITHAYSTSDVPLGWSIKSFDGLKEFNCVLNSEAAIRYFDGAIPDWAVALSSSVPRRRIVRRIFSEFNNAVSKNASLVLVILGAGCEGKTTALLQSAYNIIADNQQGWLILRRGVETQPLISSQILPLLSPDYNWLIVLDEADNAVSSINGLINNLPYNLKGKIHFLLAARDSDWSASEASALLWSGCMFVEEKISGLLPEDALSIVECWRNYGELGLGELKSTPDDEQTDCLISASKRDEGASGSAFFGALLKVRYGNDLHSHAKKMLQRLAHRKIPSGGTLKDALGYIAAMDAVGLEFLSRQVLAYTINCPEERLRRDVLFPLGEEAAATITSEHIYTRHPLIAQTLTSVLASEFGEDIDDFYLDLARSALELRVQKNKSVNELGSWRYKMADYFLESGRRDLALKIALTVLHVEPDNSKILTKVAQMYRRGGENEEACELYKEFVTGGKKILERGVFDDWSLSERASKNFSESALLLAFSLADQLFVLPPTIFNIKDNLQSICYDFKQLYELYRVSFFRELVASASRISLCLELTEEQENFFLKNAEELGVDVNTVSYIKGQFTNDLKEAVAILPEYIMSDAIQEYIGAYGELSFNKLDKIMERMVVEK